MEKLILIFGVLYLLSKKKKKRKVYSGIANNNPGNLRALPNGQKWQGQTGIDVNGFAKFSSMSLGVRALALNIKNTVNAGFNTFKSFFAHYAPKGDGTNSPDLYALAVSNACGKNVEDSIVINDDLYSMVNAIIRVENGNEYALVTQEDILNGINLA